MKILVFPRDSNPYQHELYAVLTARGHVARYAGSRTPSHTLNLGLLPFELAASRAQGFRVLHIHWLYPFALPFASASRLARRVMRMWLAFVLWTAQLLGLHIVWIAHNVLPHAQIFDDDVAARRLLLSRADAVLTHSTMALERLRSFAALPSLARVVRHPAYDVPEVNSPTIREPGPLRVLFFGNIISYKGVPDLLRAAGLTSSPVRVTVAGDCADSELRAELAGLAAQLPNRVSLRFGRLAEPDLERHLAHTDVVALPFRSVTTSGSAVYALSSGRPVVVPDDPALTDLPDAATRRYPISADPSTALAVVLDELSGELDELSAMSTAGRSWAKSYSWTDLAIEVAEVSERCVGP